MSDQKKPRHRIESVDIQEPPDSEPPQIYSVANFENQYRLNRRQLLSEGGRIAAAIALFPLILQLTGCATVKQLKVKVPKLISVKSDNTKVRDKPDGKVICTLSKGDKLDVVEKKGKWLKIKSKECALGWIAEYDAIYASYTTKTLPCGSPIPIGAICTCNCVPVPGSGGYSGGYTPYRYCYCVPVCTCNLIPVS